MEKSWNYVSPCESCHHEISQPHSTAKFSQKKKTSCSTFHVAQNDSNIKTNIKNIQVWKHHTSTSNSSPSKVSGLPFFIPKKKTWIWQRRPATSGIAPEHLGHQPGPKGQQKTSKGWFRGTTLLDEVGFFQCWKEKGWILLGWLFFGWFFVVKDAFWKLLFWSFWILLDDFFLKRLDFSGRQASMGGCGKLVTPDLWHFCCPLIGWSWVWSDMTSMLQSQPKKLSILHSLYSSFLSPVVFLRICLAEIEINAEQLSSQLHVKFQALATKTQLELPLQNHAS